MEAAMRRTVEARLEIGRGHGRMQARGVPDDGGRARPLPIAISDFAVRVFVGLGCVVWDGGLGLLWRS